MRKLPNVFLAAVTDPGRLTFHVEALKHSFAVVSFSVLFVSLPFFLAYYSSSEAVGRRERQLYNKRWKLKTHMTVIVLNLFQQSDFLFHFRTLIIENFLPPDEKTKLTNRAVYDEENEEWKLKPSSQNSR